jgi:hypothetical protein
VHKKRLLVNKKEFKVVEFFSGDLRALENKRRPVMD